MNETDRVQIAALLTSLWFDIDHEDGQHAHESFTGQASLTFDSATFIGREAIRQVYLDRAARGQRTSRHVVTNMHIVPGSPGSSRVHSVVSLYAADGAPPIPSTTPVCVADVTDHVVRDGERWLIESRRWRSLFMPSDAVLAVPTR